jgi:hypothetical protein
MFSRKELQTTTRCYNLDDLYLIADVKHLTADFVAY